MSRLTATRRRLMRLTGVAPLREVAARLRPLEEAVAENRRLEGPLAAEVSRLEQQVARVARAFAER